MEIIDQVAPESVLTVNNGAELGLKYPPTVHTAEFPLPVQLVELK